MKALNITAWVDVRKDNGVWPIKGQIYIAASAISSPFM